MSLTRHVKIDHAFTSKGEDRNSFESVSRRSEEDAVGRRDGKTISYVSSLLKRTRPRRRSLDQGRGWARSCHRAAFNRMNASKDTSSFARPLRARIRGLLPRALFGSALSAPRVGGLALLLLLGLLASLLILFCLDTSIPGFL